MTRKVCMIKEKRTWLKNRFPRLECCISLVLRILFIPGKSWSLAQIDFVSKYRTRAKIRGNLFKTRGFGRAYFRKMPIFKSCLFKISIGFKAAFFKIYLLFWLISMYSRYVYGSNIPFEIYCYVLVSTIISKK